MAARRPARHWCTPSAVAPPHLHRGWSFPGKGIAHEALLLRQRCFLAQVAFVRAVRVAQGVRLHSLALEPRVLIRLIAHVPNLAVRHGLLA